MQKKVVVIDDDQDVLEFTAFLLQDWGYEGIASLTAAILDNVAQISPDLFSG